MRLNKRSSVVAPLLGCLLFFGILLLVVAGCSPAEETESEVQEAVEEPVEVIEVNETEFSLDPTEITLERPGTYVFRAVNSGNAVHSLEIEGGGIEEETENIQPGESTELEVNLDPGTYKLYCPVGNHEERGMVGTVTVEEG
jgi:plastocyanin